MTIEHLYSNGNFHLPSAKAAYAPNLRLEPVHGEIYFHPDLESKILQSSVVWKIRSNVKGANKIDLHAEDLKIIRVESQDEHKCTYSYNGSILTILWEEGINKAEERSVKISYQVHNPIAGLYFGGGSPEMPDRGLWLATDHETTRARYWLPCIDHSNVRTTFDIHIHHKRNHVGISAGELVREDIIDDEYQCSVWQLRNRCPIYLLCIIVGEYERVDLGMLRDKPLAGFAPKPNKREDIERAFGPTKELIVFAESLLGPLPWPKYFQFAAPGIGGAMENISLVSWDSRLLFDEIMHKDLGELFDQINLHELAHTWFGDLIVCRDYAHVWLKESWATYFECVWMEHCKSTERYHLELLNKRRNYFGEVKARYSRPIMTRTFDSPWKMYDHHLYPGGAVRLHMLRNKLGSDVFWSAVRDYVNTYAECVVETDDFRRILELHSGSSLAHFFDQWFCRAGYPKLKINQQFYTDTNVLRIQIEQSIIGGKKEDLAFHLPFTIAIETAEGGWQQHHIEMDSFHHTLRVPLDKPPMQIIVDPECIAVCEIDFDPGQEMAARSFQHSPYLHGRVVAVEAMIKSGRRIAFQVVSQNWKGQFYGIREKIASSLGKSKNPQAQNLLLEMLSVEEHASVQVAIATALGSHRSLETSTALISFTQRDDVSYRATGTALLSIAKQGPYCDSEFLYQQCKHDGWRHSIREYAHQAIAYLDETRAAEILQKAITSENETFRIRGAACRSIVTCAKSISKVEEKKALKVLLDALKDPHPFVRISAIDSLGNLQNPQALPHLETMKGQVASQLWPNIDRAVQKCSSPSDKSTITALKKRLATIEEQNKKFQSQLEDIQAQLMLEK
jgi:aminopeptidase N